MNKTLKKRVLGGVAATGMAAALTLGAAGPASAAPRQQAAVVGALVAAVVQTGDIRIVTVETGDINVDIQNVLNNNQVLTDFLNNNNINVEDVVDIVLVGNTVVVTVLGVTGL